MNSLDLGQLSITGASVLDTQGEVIIERALKKLPRAPDEFTTGGADGVDTYAAEFGYQLFRHKTSIFRLCYPRGLYYNRACRRYANLIIGIDGGYLKRDDALVEYCTTLAAFPRHAQEIVRSGTWATVRRARKARRHILVFPLDGDSPWYESPTAPGERVFLLRG